MSSLLTCLVVEDEVEARTSLEAMVRANPSLRLVGSVGDGTTATQALDTLAPDLVLLDVQLPERSGIEALRRAHHRPEVIFTTASTDHTLVAFELGAIDYLLKPFGRQRFDAAIARLLARLAAPPEDPRPLDRLAAADRRPYLQRIFARKEGVLVPIPVDEIVHVEAQAEYVRLHTRRGRFLVRLTMRELATRLDPDRFAQLHRSHLVNLDAVVCFRPVDDRRLRAELDDGTTVVASRSASESLRQLAR